MINTKRYLVVIISFLVVVLLTWWFFFKQDFNPWQSTTVAYSDCTKENCERVETLKLDHGGEITFYRSNLPIDDPVQQWGTCLDSVVACYQGSSGTVGEFAGCIAVSSCPVSCKDLFAEEIGSEKELETTITAFEAVFLDKEAKCRPED